MDSLTATILTLLLSLATVAILPLANGFYAQPNVIFITDQPRDTIVCGGCGLQMSCDTPNQCTVAELPRPSIKWLINGTEVLEIIPSAQVASVSTGALTISTLSMQSMLPEHSGRFQCQVVDGNHSITCDSHSIPCVPTVTTSREINVQVIANTAPTEQVVLRGCGSSSVLSCRSRLLPAALPPILSWWKDGVQVQDNNNTHTTGAHLLESGDLFVCHAGSNDVITEYECIGTFPDHDHFNGTIVQYSVATTTDNVSSVATVELVSPHSSTAAAVVVVEGGTLELVCTLQNSNCSDSVLWTVNGTELLEPDRVLLEGRVLVLRGVRGEEGGAYCCEAVMVGGEEGEGGRSCLDVLIEENAPPLLTAPHNGSTLFLTESQDAPNTTTSYYLTISCSDPPPQLSTLQFPTEVAWYHDGVRLPVGQTQWLLQLAGSEPGGLYGVYQCLVSSLAGTSSVNTRVMPRGVTNPPGLPEATEIPRPSTTPTETPSLVDISWDPPLYTADLATSQLHYQAYINRQPVTEEDSSEPIIFSTTYFLHHHLLYSNLVVYVMVVSGRLNDGDGVSQYENASEASAEFRGRFGDCLYQVVFPPVPTLHCNGDTASISLHDNPLNAEVYEPTLDRRVYYVDAFCMHTNETVLTVLRGYTVSDVSLAFHIIPFPNAHFKAGSYCSYFVAASLQLLAAYRESPLPTDPRDTTVADTEHCYDPGLLEYSAEQACTITAVVGFEHVQYNIGENDSAVEVCAVTQGFGFTLRIATADNTAKANQDYTPTTVEWNVDSPLEDTFCVHIPILPDTVLELLRESFFANLSYSSEYDIVVDPPSTEIFITDDSDAVTVSLVDAEISFSEGGLVASVCVTVIDGDFEREINVTLNTHNESATAGMDYEELSEVVVIILPNSTESCVAVVIIDDHNLEDTETFSVQLTSTDTAVRVNSTETTVCIRDDDIVGVSLVETVMAVSEAQGSVDVCARVSGVLERGVEVAFTTLDGNATAGDYDGLVNEIVTFTPSTPLTLCVAVNITDDQILEAPEIFTVSLSTQDSDMLLSNSTAEITISDNDFVEISMPELVSVVEDQRSANVCATIDGAFQRNIDIGFTTDDDHGTALVGEDFTSLSTVVTVPPNMESRSLVCVQVDITDDSILERDSESFTVALSDTDSEVRPSTAATLVQIVDDDSISVNFSSATYTVHRANPRANICLELSGQTKRNVSITLTSQQEPANITAIVLTLTPADFEANMYCHNFFVSEELFSSAQAEGFTVRLQTDERGVDFGLSSANVKVVDDPPQVQVRLAAGLGTLAGLLFFAVLVLVAVLTAVWVWWRNKRTRRVNMQDHDKVYSWDEIFPGVFDRRSSISLDAESLIHQMEYNSPTSVEDHKDSVREYNAHPNPLIAATNPLVAQKHKLVLTHTINDSVHEWSENQPPSRKVSKESEESASYVHMADSSGQLSCLCPQCSSQRMHRTSGNSVSSSACKSNSRKVSDEVMPSNARVVSDERHSANVEMVLDNVSAPEHSQVVSSEQMLQYGDDLVISEITVVSSSHRVEFTTFPQYDNSGILSESANAPPDMNSCCTPDSHPQTQNNQLQLREFEEVTADVVTSESTSVLGLPEPNGEDISASQTEDSHLFSNSEVISGIHGVGESHFTSNEGQNSEAPNSQMNNLLSKSTLENNTTSPVANAQPHTPNNMDQLNCKMNTVSTKEDLSTSSEADSYPLDNKCKRQYYDTESPSSLTKTVKCDKDAKHIEVKSL